MWTKHEINIPLQKLDLVTEENESKEKPYNLLHQQRCRRSSRIAEEGELSQERILADSVYAIILYQSTPKECVVKVVNESGERELFARQLMPRKDQK